MKIKDICTSVTDGSHNPPQGIEKSEYMMLSSKNIFDDEITFDEPRFLSQKDFEREHKRTKIAVGDVLLTIVGTVGRTAVVDEDMPAFALQRSVAVLHPKNDVCLPRFLMYALRGKRTYIENRAKGVAQKGIYLKEVSDIDIYIPDISNQEIIINKLDKVNAIIKLRQEELLALDDLIKARFVEMFGDSVTNPKGLPIVTLGELSELITKGASPSWQGFSYTDDSSQTIFVTSENVREGYIDLSFPKYIEDGFNEKQKKSVLHRGDFLINIVGASIGRAAQFNLDCKANMNQAAALVRVNDSRVRDKYLLTYLNSDRAQRMYDSMKSDTGRANLSLQDISDLLILLPNVEQQIEFEIFVKQVDKSKVAVQKALDETQMLFDSLMQEYFN